MNARADRTRPDGRPRRPRAFRPSSPEALEERLVLSGGFSYGEAVQKALFFYEAQRIGDLPANYTVDWRGDSALNHGRDVGVDLTGGYWDDGDHVKFGRPMAGSMTELAWGVIQYRDAYARSGQLARVLDAIRWGADYMAKAHTAPNEFYGQVGRGDLDHAFWGAPEAMSMARPSFKIDAQKPGSDLAGKSAAALAAASMAFRPTDPTYANTLLTHARQLYSFADTYRGKYSDSITDAAGYYNSYSGYMDELAWAAAWNGSIAPGASIGFGFQAATTPSASRAISRITVNGVPV